MKPIRLICEALYYPCETVSRPVSDFFVSLIFSGRPRSRGRIGSEYFFKEISSKKALFLFDRIYTENKINSFGKAIIMKTEKTKKTRMVDHAGEIIDGYLVLAPLTQRAKNRLALWRIRCASCRHERTIRSDHLTAGQIPICACKRFAEKSKKGQTNE